MRLGKLFGRGGEPGDEPEVDPDETDETGGDDTVVDDETDGDDPVVDDGEAPERDAEADADDDTDPGDTSDREDDDDGEDEDDEDGEDGEDGEDDEDDEDDERGSGQIIFELADWGARERKLLDDQLGALRIPRAWEASTLVVGAGDAEVVDDVIDEIEERIALDLPPDVVPVVYEVKDWPAGLEDRFIEELIAARVPHERGYQEITVGADDEERVDEIVERVAEAWEDEQPTDDELDGPDAQHVLSELFVSSDRLLHDPSDRAGTVRFDDAASDMASMGLPFGFVQADWDAIAEKVEALRELLVEPDSADDDVIEAATALRSHLRPLV